MHIRRYSPNDISEITELFYNTVYTVNLRDYSSVQVDAWVPRYTDKDAWNSRLSEKFTVVAEQYGAIVGFASLAYKGYYDLLYVHKDYQRQGIAAALTDIRLQPNLFWEERLWGYPKAMRRAAWSTIN